MPSKRASPTAPRHEVADVSGRRIVWTAAALAMMLVVVALAAWAVLSVLRSGSRQDALKHFLEVYGANIDYRDVAERIKGLRS